MSGQGKGDKKQVPGPVIQAEHGQRLNTISTVSIISPGAESVEGKNRKIAFVIHATEDQKYAEAVRKDLDTHGFICLTSVNDYHPLNEHENSIYNSILMTDKALFIVTANSTQQFIETIQKLISKASNLEEDKVSILLNCTKDSKATQFQNREDELRLFGTLQMNISTVAQCQCLRVFLEFLINTAGSNGGAILLDLLSVRTIQERITHPKEPLQLTTGIRES
ncbi:uncharacterized protein LOC128224192 isoform X2 [Mya arenaria]|nr:uncharacterized protein LOC128224129 [Mya arenaria]XP_052789907.1 uncharacterized protein LOC128224192 isoform X2 [Mya arenaria]